MKIGGTNNLATRFTSLNALAYACFGSRIKLLRAARATRGDELAIKRALGVPREWFMATPSAIAEFERFQPADDDLRICDHGRLALRCCYCDGSRRVAVSDLRSKEAATEIKRRIRSDSRGGRMAEIVAMRIGPPMATLEEIGSAFDITRERARQILVAASADAGTDNALRAANSWRRTEAVARQAATRETRRQETMSMYRINARLGEQGLRWCARGRHVVPVCEFRTRDGRLDYRRCKSCNANETNGRRLSRLAAGLCARCGLNPISTKCVSYCEPCRPIVNALARIGAKRRAKKGTT